jgi:uncharacterized protein YcbX
MIAMDAEIGDAEDRAARVTGIVVYPVKSAGGTELTMAGVEPWGLAGDRRWAIVDEQGQRVKAVTCPAIMTITATPTVDGGLRLAAPDVPEPLVANPSPDGEGTPVGFARLDRAILAGPAAHAWLSEVLGRRVRLVWLDDPTRRPVSPARGGRPGDTLSLADTGPLLLTSNPSLRQLDEWIAAGAAERGEPAPRPLDMMRFRPNVVVDWDVPFAEDDWKRVRVGDVRFRVSELCDRCAVPTFDPKTLEQGKEPTRTLARHRRSEGKVWFGVRLIPEADGEIRIGDEVVPEPE